MDVTEDGRVIDVRLLQYLKADVPTDVSFDLIFTVFKLVQPENKPSSIDVTLTGIVTDNSERQFENA